MTEKKFSKIAYKFINALDPYRYTAHLKKISNSEYKITFKSETNEIIVTIHKYRSEGSAITDLSIKMGSYSIMSRAYGNEDFQNDLTVFFGRLIDKFDL